uniref:Uncharacterized protein n=1 Tax=Brassica oleracea var. oleracea TaxID=109376 RepID=A0A0D3DCL8_BRAOL
MVDDALRVTSLASFSNTSLSFCWFNSISRDYAEPLNKVATYTTTVKEGSSGKPVVVAAAPPRSKDQERALKPVRKVRLFTNEWPVGVTNRAAESDIPAEVSDSSCFIPLQVRWGVFYAREPYLNVDSSHVTRFLGLAQVGNKNKQNSKTISIVGDGLRKEKTLWFLKKVTSLASFSNTSLSFCWFNSISRDYAEPLNKVATYTTTVKEGSSGKPVVVAAAPPRSKDQERALKPVRKVRFVLDNDEDLRDIC